MNFKNIAALALVLSTANVSADEIFLDLNMSKVISKSNEAIRHHYDSRGVSDSDVKEIKLANHILTSIDLVNKIMWIDVESSYTKNESEGIPEWCNVTIEKDKVEEVFCSKRN